MAGGVVAALTAQGLAGSVPVSGQDGDHANINRIALGTQTVDVWKDSRDLGHVSAQAALDLAAGKKMADIPGVKPFTGGAKGVKVNGILLKRLFVEGGEVKAGQQLYQIDPAPYQAAYDSAVAAFERHRHHLCRKLLFLCMYWPAQRTPHTVHFFFLFNLFSSFCTFFSFFLFIVLL